ncbi:MAG: hypothetical protein EZS28_054290, partial [Streblomastix strix]
KPNERRADGPQATNIKTKGTITQGDVKQKNQGNIVAIQFVSAASKESIRPVFTLDYEDKFNFSTLRQIIPAKDDLKLDEK